MSWTGRRPSAPWRRACGRPARRTTTEAIPAQVPARPAPPGCPSRPAHGCSRRGPAHRSTTTPVAGRRSSPTTPAATSPPARTRRRPIVGAQRPGCSERVGHRRRKKPSRSRRRDLSWSSSPMPRHRRSPARRQSERSRLSPSRPAALARAGHYVRGPAPGTFDAATLLVSARQRADKNPRSSIPAKSRAPVALSRRPSPEVSSRPDALVCRPGSRTPPLSPRRSTCAPEVHRPP